MSIKQIKDYIFKGRFAYNKKLALIFWFGLSFLSVLQVFLKNKINNYHIFKGVFLHLRHAENLYISYPAEYMDTNLYGPFFSVVIAPFAWLPDSIGVFLWVFANSAFLLFAFSRLPLSSRLVPVLAFLCCNELIASSGYVQVNPIICGCIILGFAYTHKGKDAFALFFIMAATFIKIYGIVGLAFFFFSKNRLRFLKWAVVWSVVFFFAPLIFTNFSFLFHSYADWIDALKEKNLKNISSSPASIHQNVAVSGMIRRIFHLSTFNDLFILVPAALLFLSQYLKYKYFNDIRFRLYFLCSTLIAVVIFSTSAESSTYIIAMPGICTWYLLQRRTKRLNIFFAVVFIVTTFSYSDIFSPWVSNHIFKPYSLKALMPFVVWLIIIIQVYKNQFLNIPHPLQKGKEGLFAV